MLTKRTLPNGRIIFYRDRLKKKIPDWYPINEVWGRREYTPDGFDVYDNNIVIDIGAHVGAFTIYSATRAKNIFVFSYEPMLENFLILEKNINSNNLNNVRIFRLAIAKKAGKRRLVADQTNDSGASFFITGNVSEMVECLTLEDVFNSNGIENCDFMKIDCEGAEYEILYHTPDKIFKKINRIALEYHIPNSSPRYNHKALMKFLIRHGYSVFKYVPKGDTGIICLKR